MVRTFGMFSLMKIWKMTNESIFSGLKLYKFYYIVVNYEFSDNIGSKIKENSEQSEESAPEALFVWSAFNHLIWCYNNSQVCMREGGTFRAKPWKQLCEQAKHSCFIFIWRKKNECLCTAPAHITVSKLSILKFVYLFCVHNVSWDNKMWYGRWI